jgi:hypothetical protein
MNSGNSQSPPGSPFLPGMIAKELDSNKNSIQHLPAPNNYNMEGYDTINKSSSPLLSYGVPK